MAPIHDWPHRGDGDQPGPNNRASTCKQRLQSCSVPILGFSHIWPVREGYYHPYRAFCDARHSGGGQS